MITKMLTSFLMMILIITTSSFSCQEAVYLLPMPKKIQCVEKAKVQTIKNPCAILYHVKQQKEIQHISELIKHQQFHTFNCKIPNIIFSPDISNVKLQGFQYKLVVQIKDTSLKSVFQTHEQAYTLNIDAKKSQLQSNNYVGFVRGLQTFLQTIQCPKMKYKNCKMRLLPLKIQDQPAFKHRGLMIDSARHYIKKSIILETIDALMYNKMNVMHWHLVDQDSFPLILNSHPEIAKSAAFSDEETYTINDVKQIIRYAMVRGVRIIPELDTPGHAVSWGLAPENVKVACIPAGYMGPLDVTLDKTYKLIKQVFAQIMSVFPDPYIHLGGDQVELRCFENKTNFLEKQGIKQSQMQMRYRQKQHKILQELNSSKIFMYWQNTQKVDIEKEDVAQWWGDIMLPKTDRKIIISTYGPFYLDLGVGNYLGDSYGSFANWMDIYNHDVNKNIQNYSNKQNVLGAQLALWSQISNQYTHHIKIWMRSSSFAQKMWNTWNQPIKPLFMGRITAHERLMNRRGIPTAPVTCQQCEIKPANC